MEHTDFRDTVGRREQPVNFFYFSVRLPVILFALKKKTLSLHQWHSSVLAVS